ncbi:hypothetical protein HDR58_10745 [bacterium]|nr:hypothetical protein [bacterium]
MKNLLLLLTLISISSAAIAAEPLLLEPLNPTVLSTPYGVSGQQYNASEANGPQVSVQGENGVYEATFTPANKLDPNMVPQNAAAEGKPVAERRQPRVRVRTKQRSQGNSYWNPGGKGTKSYF